jgi:hypothetical protein
VVPALIPVTIPVVEVTVATVPVLLVQIPGVGAEANVIVVPTQTDEGPEIGEGSGFTVNVLVEKHVPGVV